MILNIEYPFTKNWEKAYLVNSQGRNSVCLVRNNSKERKTISYARYLMSVHLKRYLTEDEQVDHINNIKSDDRIENLQILTQYENQLKYRKANNIKRKHVLYQCPICLNTFEKKHNKSHYFNKAKSACCSKECRNKLRKNPNIEPKIIILDEYSK